MTVRQSAGAPTLSSRPLVNAWRQAGGLVESAQIRRPSGMAAAWRLSPKGSPKGRVVIGHATGNDAFYPHAGLIKMGLQLGFEVFVFDLDGHGTSSTTRLIPNDAASMIDDALREARRYDSQLPTHVIGQSLSAALAFAAIADGVTVTSLIAVAMPTSPVVTPLSAVAELRTLGRDAFWALRFDYGLRNIMPAFGPVRRNDYPVRLVDEHRQAFRYPGVVDQLIRSLDLKAKTGTMRTPLLMIHGERDKVVPVAQAVALLACLPLASLVVIPGATHFSTVIEPMAIDAMRRHLGTGSP